MSNKIIFKIFLLSYLLAAIFLLILLLITKGFAGFAGFFLLLVFNFRYSGPYSFNRVLSNLETDVLLGSYNPKTSSDVRIFYLIYISLFHPLIYLLIYVFLLLIG
jgi:hypothetical protein